jgi:hypothetical protein
MSKIEFETIKRAGKTVIPEFLQTMGHGNFFREGEPWDAVDCCAAPIKVRLISLPHTTLYVSDDRCGFRPYVLVQPPVCHRGHKKHIVEYVYICNNRQYTEWNNNMDGQVVHRARLIYPYDLPIYHRTVRD